MLLVRFFSFFFLLFFKWATKKLQNSFWMQLEKVLQLNLQYLVYFVTNETDIQLKGQERKLVYTSKKTELQGCLSISSIVISKTSSKANKQTSSQLNPNWTSWELHLKVCSGWSTSRCYQDEIVSIDFFRPVRLYCDNQRKFSGVIHWRWRWRYCEENSSWKTRLYLVLLPDRKYLTIFKEPYLLHAF